MGVLGTRLPTPLEQNVRDHCLGLGKTPSVWLRELVEREISGRMPSPAVGDAIKGLNELTADNGKFAVGILAVSLGMYKTIIQSEMSNHPERAEQLEKTHRELVASLIETLPQKGQLTVEMGVRISDLESEIERVKSKKQALKEGQDG